MTQNRPLHLSDAQSRASEPEDPALVAAVAAVVWNGDEDFLLARIQRSRAAGERVSLPQVSMQTSRLPLRSRRNHVVARVALLIVTLAAAAVLVLVSRSERVTGDRSSPARQAVRTDSATPSNVDGLAALLAPWPRLAYAQSPASMPQPYAPVQVNGSTRVLPGERAYVQLVAPREGDAMVPIDAFVELVRSDTVRGEAAWLVTRDHQVGEDRQGRRTPSTQPIRDSLLIDAATLRPIAHRLTAGDASRDNHIVYLEQFSRREVRLENRIKMKPEDLRLTAPTQRDGRYLVLKEQRALDTTRLFVPYEQSLHLLLQALPLHDGWRGSIQVPEALGAVWSKTSPLNLRVDGVDTVSVFRDRYPTWRVLVENGPTPEVWHVRQRTGEVLLVEQRYRGGAMRAQRYLMAGLLWPDSGRVGGPAR